MWLHSGFVWVSFVIQNCSWILWYSWSAVHRGEQSHIQSLRADRCRGQHCWLVLSFPILLVRLWRLHTAHASPLASALLLVVLCMLIVLLCLCLPAPFIPFWLPPPLLPTPDSYTAPPSVSWCSWFLLFLHGVQVLTGIALRIGGETGFLDSFLGIQGTELSWKCFSRAAQCSWSKACDVLTHWGWHEVLRRGPEKLVHVQCRLYLQRTGLLNFMEELRWACAMIFPLFHFPDVSSSKSNVFFCEGS